MKVNTLVAALALFVSVSALTPRHHSEEHTGGAEGGDDDHSHSEEGHSHSEEGAVEVHTHSDGQVHTHPASAGESAISSTTSAGPSSTSAATPSGAAQSPNAARSVRDSGAGAGALTGILAVVAAYTL